MTTAPRAGGNIMTVYILIFILGLAALYALSPRGIFAGKNGALSGTELNNMQELFFRTVFTLLGYVAKRDGPVNDKEVKRTETFMEKMDLDATHKREAIRLFKTGADPAFKVQETVANFKGLAKKSPNLAQILLVYLINLARVDGALVNKEVEAVAEVAFGLGYSNIMFKQLLKMISAQNQFSDGLKRETNSGKKADEACAASDKKTNGESSSSTGGSRSNSDRAEAGRTAGDKKPLQDDSESCAEKTKEFQEGSVNLKSAYDVLEVSPGADKAEVKKAYRRLVNQYHPDKLIGMGLPPYMVQASTECFKTIQAAYEYVEKAR